MSVTNLRGLLKTYTIYSNSPIKTIKLIYEDEILDSAVGTFRPRLFDSFDTYIRASMSCLSGFVDENVIVSWYRSDVLSGGINDHDLKQIAHMVMEEKSDIVIVESNKEWFV